MTKRASVPKNEIDTLNGINEVIEMVSPASERIADAQGNFRDKVNGLQSRAAALVNTHMVQQGFVKGAIPDNYTENPPNIYGALQQNLGILEDLTDGTDEAFAQLVKVEAGKIYEELQADIKENIQLAQRAMGIDPVRPTMTVPELRRAFDEQKATIEDSLSEALEKMIGDMEAVEQMQRTDQGETVKGEKLDFTVKGFFMSTVARSENEVNTVMETWTEVRKGKLPPNWARKLQAATPGVHKNDIKNLKKISTRAGDRRGSMDIETIRLAIEIIERAASNAKLGLEVNSVKLVLNKLAENKNIQKVLFEKDGPLAGKFMKLRKQVRSLNDRVALNQQQSQQFVRDLLTFLPKSELEKKLLLMTDLGDSRIGSFSPSELIENTRNYSVEEFNAAVKNICDHPNVSNEKKQQLRELVRE